LWALNRLFVHAYHRLDVRTPSTVPDVGPAIIAANHTCHLDPVFIQACCRRPVTWMMAADMMAKARGFGWLLRWLDVIPIHRSGRDRGGLRFALDALAQGRVIGVFPEGRIEPDRALLPLMPGVATLIERSGVKVHPVWIESRRRRMPIIGTYLIPRRASITHGPAMPPTGDARTTLAALSAALQSLGQNVSASN
jgi:1-acyl-sn-glycerol-3-phosphate acyltransferase